MMGNMMSFQDILQLICLINLLFITYYMSSKWFLCTEVMVSYILVGNEFSSLGQKLEQWRA